MDQKIISITDFSGKKITTRAMLEHFCLENEEFVINQLKKDVEVNPNTKFILVNKVESDNIDYENSYFPVRLIANFFRDNSLSHRFEYWSGNLNGRYRGIVHKPIFPYFNRSYNKVLNLERNNFNKTFLFLNRKIRTHRKLLFNFFKENNLLNCSYYSYDAMYFDGDQAKSLEGFKISSKYKKTTNRDIDPTFYEKSFCSIVTETFFFQDPYYGLDSFMITEKTIKPIANGHPFILVAQPYSLRFLKELGFKTFDKWWDESYDTIEDGNLRLEKIKEVILEISKFNINKLNSIYNDIIPILTHNRNLQKKYRKLQREYADKTIGKDFFFIDELKNLTV